MKTTTYQERVFLTGFMGSGKSYVGKKLALELGWTFIDLDDCVISEYDGMSIPQIFVNFGEDAFRRMEAKCLRDLANKTQIVVASGGGTPCFHQNMDWMLENGLSIYLKSSIGLSMQRLEPQTAHRPLLANKTGEELKTLIANKMADRAADYERANWIYFQTHNSKDIIKQLAERIKGVISDK